MLSTQSFSSRPRRVIHIALTATALVLIAAKFAGDAQAYDEAGHYYTVGVVLLDSGRNPLSPKESGLVTFCSWLPDETRELSAVAVYNAIGWVEWAHWGYDGTAGTSPQFGAMVAVQQEFHDLTGGSATAVQGAAAATLDELLQSVLAKPKEQRDPEDLCALGFALHLYGDSFAHEDAHDSGRMYPTGSGHLTDGHKPDYPLYCFDEAHKWERLNLWASFMTGVQARFTIGLSAIDDELKRAKSYIGTHSNNSESGELWLRSDLCLALEREVKGDSGLCSTEGFNRSDHETHLRAPAFFEADFGLFGLGLVDAGDPCNDYVQRNYKAELIFAAPQCEESWHKYHDVVVKHFFGGDTAIFGSHLMMPQFKDAEPIWQKKK